MRTSTGKWSDTSVCGIAGFWDMSRQNALESEAILQRMIRTLAHRGPDDEGYYGENADGLYLGHRRLSIVDLSPCGHQPMVSSSGRYVIVFNGEVYNHRSLRTHLEKDDVGFRGHSDTEVMLAAVERWGLTAAVTRFNGMFAFGLWDRKEGTLALVRDRVGIKPLYYGWCGRTFIFASELKALRSFPTFDNPINRDALTLFLRHNYVPGPQSIYHGIYKLMPGTILLLNRQRAQQPGTLEDLEASTTTYWSAREVAQKGCSSRFTGSVADALAELECLLSDAVALRMEADVPVGAFLSGGIDSSAVVSLMQAQSSRSVRTFSIGFHETGFDEAAHAKLVAKHLRTDHSELYISPRDAMEVIPKLPQMYDEPFADSSQIPTFLVSRFAGKHVKVALSGDGGDELFAGYNRYLFANTMWSTFSRIPGAFRRTGAQLLRSRPGLWGAAVRLTTPLFPRRFRVNDPRSKVLLLSEVLAYRSLDELYRHVVSHWKSPERVVRGGKEPLTALTNPSRQATVSDDVERMMYKDLVSYLPDDILTKIDRASMAVGLEARVPLLDYRVVEFAWRLPMSLKMGDGQGKRLLRQLLYKNVPRKLVERPKQGFGVPISEWLRGDLREWAESLLDERRLRAEGYFDAGIIRQTWSDHLAGRSDEHYRLWDILMFQAWLAEQGAQASELGTKARPLPSSSRATQGVIGER